MLTIFSCHVAHRILDKQGKFLIYGKNKYGQMIDMVYRRGALEETMDPSNLLYSENPAILANFYVSLNKIYIKVKGLAISNQFKYLSVPHKFVTYSNCINNLYSDSHLTA